MMRVVRVRATTVVLVVVGLGIAGAAGMSASLVCWKQPSSYCGAAQLGWTLVAGAALLAVAVGVAWLWRRPTAATRVISSALVGLLGLVGVLVVLDGSGRERPTIVGVLEVVEPKQVCWRPVELAPLTEPPRPVPARLEGAPRCAPVEAVRDDGLASDETVDVALLRARYTQRWQVTSVRMRNTVVAVVEDVVANEVCWRPIGLAPLTETPRPVPARLEEAPRCATLDVVRDEQLGHGQTVHVDFVHDYHTDAWRAFSVRVRDTRPGSGS